MTIDRINILGIHLSAINMQMALDTFEDWIMHRIRHYICVTGVHGVMESQTDASLRNALNGAGLVTPDGMPMVWVSRLRGYNHVSRVYGPDLMLAVCERSLVTGWKHFLYGGMQGVPERLAQRLSEHYPGINIVGIYSPPFEQLSEEQEAAIAKMLNESGADIVWVGLGMPKQEKWMAEHRDRLNVPVLVGVGAAFDFHSGNKLQAPRWMQQSGLEWVFRLATEPRRLWGRYFPNNPKFMLLAALQLLGLRSYEDTPK